MDSRHKRLIGAGGVAILPAAAGVAVAQPERGPGGADAHGDGQITSMEIEAAAKARFAEADANKDGRLTGDDFA